MISCILLTAGESSRFGSPKALVPIGSHTAIELLQKKLLDSLVAETIIVTGAHESVIKPYVFNHSKVHVVHNKDYKLGQTGSFQAGLLAVDKKSKGFLLLPIDCPFVLARTINSLIEYFYQRNPDILIPTYQGRRGHPPIFHQRIKDDILNLPITQGLNSLFLWHQVQTIETQDPGVIAAFNTPEELKGYLKTMTLAL